MSNLNDKMMTFAVVQPYVVSSTKKPTETYVKSRDMVRWGEENDYPNFLMDLYKTAPTLASVIGGSIDFTIGDDVILNRGTQYVNRKQTAKDLATLIARDLWIFNGCALQVLRNADGGVAEIYHIDLRFLRTNKDANVFYYNEEWTRYNKGIVYPEYLPSLDWRNLDEAERERNVSSIFYDKGLADGAYPQPIYQAAIPSCEIERDLDMYHKNSLANGFSPSAVINFNNGAYTEDEKARIQMALEKKFCGVENAGALMCAFNESKESAVTIEAIKTEDFGDRYNALWGHCRQQIFTSFRANPNLFGIPTDNNGFAAEQYQESFKLYNRTHITPIQKRITEIFEKIYGQSGVLTIVPFSLETTGEDNIE